MGELYVARTVGSDGINQLVALKRLRPALQTTPDAARQLLGEARIMASLRHPNIAQIYDADTQGVCPFIVMEYVQGENLGAVLAQLGARGRGLSLPIALWIICNVAAALHHAHQARNADGSSAGIVHRDVCPSNVLITSDGHVKLIDFGVAKAVQREHDTLPGTIKGHVRYLSPEQYLGGDLDGRSDVFSLGIVLFELTTGTRWLRERDDAKAVQVMLNGQYPRPSERRAGYPEALETIVERALQRNRELRHDDARALQRELEEFAASQQLTLSSIALSETMQSLFGPGETWSTQRLLNELSAKYGQGPRNQIVAPASATLRLDPGAGPQPALEELTGSAGEVQQSGQTLRLERSSNTVPPQEHRGSRSREAVVALLVVAALASAAWWMFPR